MKVKVFTTDSADAADAMRANMALAGFEIVVCNQAKVVTVLCNNLTNGTTASGDDSWVVIGKK